MEYKTGYHNPEDRNWWYEEGVKREKLFVDKIVPLIGMEGRIILNPAKEVDPKLPDLLCDGNIADLKSIFTPFFKAKRFKIDGVECDPRFTITFNRKDYIRYNELYPDIDIYLWVHWQTLYGYNVVVDPLMAIYHIPFYQLADDIEKGLYPLHAYKNRTDDNRNAKDSYVVDVRRLHEIGRLVG